MNKIILSILVLSVIVFSVEDVTTSKVIAKPTKSIIKRVRPIARPVVHQDNYYNTYTTSSCESYIATINQQDVEISALKKELESLRNKEQLKIQKKLQKEYSQELKDFDNRKIDRTTKSRATISDKPIN